MKYDHPYKTGKQLVNDALNVWKQDETRCVICGKYCSVTREHCPPKAIYPNDLPNDIVTVPSCSDCQSSPDIEFAIMLAFKCAKKPTINSKDLLEKNIARFEANKIPNKFLDFLKEEIKLNSNEAGIIDVNWPNCLHDSMVLKFVHAYFWLLNEGRLLSDFPGSIALVPDYNAISKSGEFLVGRSFPSVNIGNGQFILTLIRGFDEPPYDTTASMGFHFHTNNCVGKGYNVLVFLLLDQYRNIGGNLGEKFIEIQNRVDSSLLYDTKKPVHELYDY